jgi:hypothetical protein
MIEPVAALRRDAQFDSFGHQIENSMLSPLDLFFDVLKVLNQESKKHNILL